MSAKHHQLLGEILIREGKLQEPQLAEALDAQEIFGGRLGTNLVDLDLLSALEVGSYLALQLGMPEARPEDFLAVTPRLVEIFPRELAGRLQVFPLRSVEGVLHLAMVSPTALPQIDEVVFATGLRVKPYVAPELQMLFFLEQRFGFARDKRFMRVRLPDEPQAVSSEEVVHVVPPHLGETTLSDTRGRRIEIASSAVRGDPTGPFANSPSRPTHVTPLPARVVMPPPLSRPTHVTPRPVRVAPAPLAPMPSEEISEADLELVFLDDVRASRGAAVEEEDFEVTLVEPEEPAAKPSFSALAAATAPSTIEELFADLEPEAAAAPPPAAMPVASRSPGSSALVARPPTAAPAKPASPAPAVDLGAELEIAFGRAKSKDEVAAALVRAGSDQPSVAVLFLVRGETAIAATARGTELGGEELARLILPLSSSRLFREAAERKEPVRGSAAEDPMLQVISGFLRSGAPEEACVAPVILARRAVNLLYLQAPLGSHLLPNTCERLAGTCGRAASSYARLIRELKRSS